MSTQINYSQPRLTYLNVLADGKFHKVVEEGTPGAVRRDYETSDGKKGTKYELIVDSIEGKITNLDIYEGDYGNQLKVSFGEGEEEIIVSLPTASSFGIDFMKKLPLLNLEEVVKIAPYSFEADGKKKKGVTVYQNGEKVASNYQDFIDNKTVNKNDFPEIQKERDAMKTKDWQKYFITVSEFLEEEVKKSAIYNVKKPIGEMSFDEKNEMYPKDENPADKIPF
jgi:hypothetical protein